MWALDTAPTNWIECDGGTTAAYPELAALLGATVPDLRGQFVRGWDNGKGTDSGRAINTEQGEDFLSHAHSITDKQHSHSYDRSDEGSGTSGGSTGVHDYNASSTSGSQFTGITGTNSEGGSETRPVNTALMYIIRAS